MHIIFEGAPMLFTHSYLNWVKINLCLSELQLAKVGAFFETQCGYD